MVSSGKFVEAPCEPSPNCFTMQRKDRQGDEVETLYQLFLAYGPYLWLAVVVAVVLLWSWLLVLQGRLNRLTRHYRRVLPNGRGTLEEVLEQQLAELHRTKLKMEDVLEAVEQVESSSRRALQHVGVLRFNPFEDTGGDQSFCVALLDGDESGVVLTSIFSRAQCRVYAKPIEKGHSRYQLMAEEEEALRLAKDGKAKSVVR